MKNPLPDSIAFVCGASFKTEDGSEFIRRKVVDMGSTKDEQEVQEDE